VPEEAAQTGFGRLTPEQQAEADAAWNAYEGPSAKETARTIARRDESFSQHILSREQTLNEAHHSSHRHGCCSPSNPAAAGDHR
jgi:hypothetical protein